MNIDFLRSFYFTVKHNNISKAAKHLHITQPALSMQLQNLENTFKVKLLIRGNKGVELTDEGKVVFQYASNLLSIEDNIKKDLECLKKNKEVLYINACKNIGEYTLPCAIYTFKEINPRIDINLSIDNSNNILKKLIENDINLGIVLGKISNDDLVFEHVLSDKFILVTNPNQKISKISINEIYNIPLIFREKDCAASILMEKLLDKHSIKVDNLNITLRMNSPQSIKSSILSGMGFAFLPEIIARHSIRSSQLKEVQIPNFNTSFEYYVVYRKDYTLTNSERKFINFIKSDKRCFCY